MNQEELKHFGIKGMKWGIRRFQNEDGSLTPAGRERYDDDGPNDSVNKQETKPASSNTVKKSKHRTNLEQKFQNAGMTETEAERAAAKRIKTEKYVAAFAATAVVAGVAYYKYREYSKDKKYDTDTEFQRIMSLADDQTIQNGRQYVAVNKLDKLKYKGVYAQELSRKTPKENKLYNVSVKPGQEIKVASRKNAERTFRELYDNDAGFRKSLKDEADMYKLWGISPDKPFEKAIAKIGNDEQLTNAEYKKAYDYFNRKLTSNSEHADKFYKELARKGYNAVQDRNDQKYSGYNTKNPLILFDGKYDYKKVEMAKEQVKKDAAKGTLAIFAPDLIKGGAAYTALGVGTKKLTDRQTKAHNAKMVALYREQHPNTKMTDEEIEKMLLAQSN